MRKSELVSFGPLVGRFAPEDKTCDFDAVVEVLFRENIADVLFDGSDANFELSSDLLVT